MTCCTPMPPTWPAPPTRGTAGRGRAPGAGPLPAHRVRGHPAAQPAPAAAAGRAARPGVTPEILTCAADARAWFAAERQVLLAAIGQADEAGLETYAWQLPWAVWLFFDREGYWHDQVAIQLTAIAAAKRLGDRAAQAHVYRDLSATYSRLGQLAEARVYCTQALDLHRELGDRLGEARAHNDIMILAERQGQAGRGAGPRAAGPRAVPRGGQRAGHGQDAERRRLHPRPAGGVPAGAGVLRAGAQHEPGPR